MANHACPPDDHVNNCINASITRVYLQSERRFHIKAGQMFKVLHDSAPVRPCNIFRNSCSANSYHLRNADNKLALPLPKTEFLKKSFKYNGAKFSNSLPNEIRDCEAFRLCLTSLFQPNSNTIINFLGLY